MLKPPIHPAHAQTVPVITAFDAVKHPRFVTLNGALASVEHPAQNAIASEVVQADIPTAHPAAGQEQKIVEPKVNPPTVPQTE